MINQRRILPSHRKLKNQNFNLIILRLKSLVRSPSFSVGSVLSILSLILIITPYLSGKNVNFSEISQNIGFNLLGAVAAFVAFEIIFRKLKEAEEQQGVELDFFKKTEFIKMVFQTNFTYKFLQNHTAPIRIMETWTGLLRDKEYKEKFISAIFNSIDNNNAAIEILLLDPENRDLIKARTKELKDTSPEFSEINIEENIYTNLYEIQEIKKQLEKRGKSDKLKIKFYNTSPSIALYMCSPNLFVSFFRSGKLTTMSKQLKLPVNSPMAEFINERFDEIWQDPKTKSLEDRLYVKVEVTQGGMTQGIYDKVQYIRCEEGYYIQHAELFNDIANKQNINLKIRGRTFKYKNVVINDLSEIVQKLFLSKYPRVEKLFIFLE
ncbi:hypothetical protein WA1_20665 [Scytonema hofmannii PCC 7110]|uniref:Uncharacterized protein n=1 Tax=Scytonema hofmannii PCC 7110 TaxID=128403 RepID=A0A139XCK8_9CYAN|nr:hypothetical protein WA1_20665 [Scytonema hofmannii PCC 7110]